MHTEITLYRPDEREALQALETSLERPIRILTGRGRTYTECDWSIRMVEDCSPFTREQCETEGLTIVSYGTVHATRFHNLVYNRDSNMFSHDAFHDGYTFYDTLKGPDNNEDWTAEPLTIGTMVVGEVVGRTILHHNNWLQYETCNIGLLVEEPFIRSLDPAAMAAFVERQAAVTRDRFVAYASKTSDTGIRHLTDEIGELMRSNGRAVAEATRTKLELRGKQKMLDAVMAGGESATEAQVLETWGRLLDDPRIENVRFDSANRVVLDTTGMNITRPDTNETAYLGKMRWIITADGADMCEVHNLDNARGGFDHPHVHMNKPCFGELGSTIYTLIKQGKLYPAVELIFAFLGSVNMNDDWGRRAAFWFDDDEDSPRNTNNGVLIEA